MLYLGDVKRINGAFIKKVHVISFGAPCQDLSIAGKRAGMKHEGRGDDETTRSGLFFESVRIMKEMRASSEAEGKRGSDVQCRWAIYENVQGAFSSNEGRDFQSVLTELIRVKEPDAPDVPLPPKGKWGHAGYLYDELGQWSVAWLLHDAQYHGVPQRRKRVCVCADYGGLDAGRVLFEPELQRETPDSGGYETVAVLGMGRAGEVSSFISRLCRDLEAGGEARESAPAGAEGGAGASGGGIVCGNPWDSQSERVFYGDGTWHSLNANSSGGQSRDAILTEVLPFDTTQVTSPENGSHPKPGDPCHPLAQSAHTPTVAYCIQGNCIDRADTAGCNGRGWTKDVSYTLNTIDRPAVCGFSAQNSSKAGSIGYQPEQAPTLRAGQCGFMSPVVSIYSFDSLASNSMKSRNPVSGCRRVEVAKTLDCADPNPSKNQGGIAVVQVRIPKVFPDKAGSLCASGYDKLGTQEAANGLFVVEGVDGYNATTTGDVEATLGINCGISSGRNGVQISVFDARGNGDGTTVPTLTGDHQDRVTDYTAIVVEPKCDGGSDIAPTLTANNAGGNQRMLDKDNFNAVLVPDSTSYTLQIRGGCEGGGKGALVQTEKSATLGVSQTQTLFQIPKGFAMQAFGVYADDDVGSACKARDYKDATDLVVAVDCRNFRETPECGTLQAKETGGHSLNYTNPIRAQSIVRRLTPVECERLQNFPDNWSAVGIMPDGTEKVMSDSTRYKMQGNSIARPFWRKLLARISSTITDDVPTLGSLFDGQGGFPLCWAEINGPDSVLWSSEIVEDAAAVVRKHFGDEERGIHGDFYEAITHQFIPNAYPALPTVIPTADAVNKNSQEDNTVIEIRVAVTAPELATAISSLAAALEKSGISALSVQPEAEQTPQKKARTRKAKTEAAETEAAETTESPEVQEEETHEVDAPASAEEPKEEAPAVENPAPVTEVGPVRTYTRDQIALCGADLIDKGQRSALVEILHRYKVNAIPQLPDDQTVLAAIADELRALGGDI